MPEQTDPHMGLWAELQRIESAIDWSISFPPDEDALADRVTELENLIVGTAPTTTGGAVIIALALLRYQDEVPSVELDFDAQAGRTLAQWLLSQEGVA